MGSASGVEPSEVLLLLVLRCVFVQPFEGCGGKGGGGVQGTGMGRCGFYVFVFHFCARWWVWTVLR